LIEKGIYDLLEDPGLLLVEYPLSEYSAGIIADLEHKAV
jgi:hypothetical protein